MARLVCGLVLFACSGLAQDFDEQAFARDLRAIVPAGAELAWRSLPWRAELRAAMLAASEQQKPVLLWAMNGHPLGQT